VKKIVTLLLFSAVFIGGCSLAGDVTPPPDLATAQAAQPISPRETQIPQPPSLSDSLSGEAPASSPDEADSSIDGEEGVKDRPSLGALNVQVVNGTTGAEVPSGLETKLVVIDGEEVSFGETSALDETGRFSFEDVSLLPDRVYGVVVAHQGVQYFSDVIHLSEVQPIAEVPVVIYETTTDKTQVVAERLHVLFNTSVEDQIDVTELWVLSNQSDRTVTFPDPQHGLEFHLPDGFTNLSFAADTAMVSSYVMTERGFSDLTPLRPGEGSQVVFSFTLPYSQRFAFKQDLGIEVKAVVILVPEGAPSVSATGIQDLGIQEMGGMRLHNYSLGSFAVGDVLDLRLSEGSPLWLYGLIILLAVGIAVAFFWFGTRRAKRSTGGIPIDVPVDRQSAIEAIAALDDAYAAGTMSDEDYRTQRDALKAEALRMMRGLDD
jgi:hypothetical protein